MNLLFIGNSFPPGILSTFVKDTRGKNNLSLHNFEQSILSGISKQTGLYVKVVLVPWVGTFPISYTKPIVSSESFSSYGLDIDSVGYCNFIAFNKFSRKNSLRKQLLKTFEAFPEGCIHVLVNTYKYSVLKGLKEAKELSNRDITQTVIMTDMPGFDASNRKMSFLKKWWKQKDIVSTMELVRESDSIVSITQYFLDYFDKPIRNVVVEGMVNPSIMDIDAGSEAHENKVVLYTGTLLRIYGVMNLVDAFEKANVSGSELWICGSGETAEEIKARSVKNPSIKFLGLLPSDVAWRKQREATVLVNPRTSDGEYTKYSFPSKTLEYLLSGRPVIVNRLPGFPDEYGQYCIFPKDETVESLAECIKSVLSMSEEERSEIGKKGREFVIKEKNAQKQVSRIIDMLKQTS